VLILKKFLGYQLTQIWSGKEIVTPCRQRPI